MGYRPWGHKESDMTEHAWTLASIQPKRAGQENKIIDTQQAASWKCLVNRLMNRLQLGRLRMMGRSQDKQKQKTITLQYGQNCQESPEDCKN